MKVFYVIFLIQYINIFAKAVYSPPKTHKIYEEVNASNDIVFNDSINAKNIKGFFGNDTDTSDNEVKNIDFREIAINHLIKETGISRDELLIKDIINEDSVVHVHLCQVIGGKPLSNVAANVNINKNTGNVLSYGSTLMPKVMKDTSQDNLNLDFILPVNKIYSSKFVYGNQSNMTIFDIISKFSTTLGYSVDTSKLSIVENTGSDKIIVKGVGYTYDDTIEIEEKVIPLGENSFDNVYELTVDLEDHLLVADVSSSTAELYDIYDLARSATYRAVPWNNVDIGEGGLKLIVNPENINASPRGWNRDGEYLYYYTNGNNVKAVLDWDKQVSYEDNKKFIRSSKNKELVFDYNFDSKAKTAKSNYSAAVTNAFYITNILHDFYYVYGFTEKYGNFQTNNFGKGGTGNDQLILLIQNSDGNNNAYMVTGADGRNPRMRLLVYNRIKDSERDPAFSNQVIIHEYTHGVSSRLVGGPSQTGCFKEPEADCINEGLSDFFSLLLTTKKNDNSSKEVIWAKWLSNGTSRKYPYTRNQKNNPLTYKDLSHEKSKNIESHLGGQLFASIMYDVIFEVKEAYPFTSNIILHPDGENSDLKLTVNNEKLPGNVRLAKIVIDALKNMPCNPTFIEARDSIIQAQQQFSNFKKMRCALWKGFAARGLGINAKGPTTNGSTVTYTNNNDIPKDC